jgi:hypothetical protein
VGIEFLSTDVQQNWSAWVQDARPADAVAPHTRRVLLVSYEFPPVGGSGVQRPLKLAKYLGQFGWSVEVLTARHDRFPWHDATLLRDIPAACAVHRVSGHEPACLARRVTAGLRIAGPAARRWVEDRVYWRLARWTARNGNGNGEHGWIGPAIRAAISLHRRHSFDAIVSTGPPHFVHEVARVAAARLQIPWIADLRDPLVSDFDRCPAARDQSLRQQRLEARILRSASAIVTTTQAFADDLRQRYSDGAKTIGCIYNGFDRDDLIRHVSAASPRRGGRCVLLAAGSFYGRRELWRILQPMGSLIAQNPGWNGRVELMLAGTIDAQQRQTLEQSTPDWLRLYGYVNHDRCIELALQADCSIMIVPDCRHGALSVPAKTFELTALPRHVLGLVPSGSESERILRRAGACTLAPLEDESAVSAALHAVIEASLSGTLPHTRNWRNLQAYDRCTTAAQFAAVLDAVAAGVHERSESDDAFDAELVLAREAGRMGPGRPAKFAETVELA